MLRHSLLKKMALGIVAFGVFIFTHTNAADFTYYYGQGCSHCAKVAEFFKAEDIEKKYNIEKKEVYFDTKNRDEFLAVGKKMGISLDKLGVPFMVNNLSNTSLGGDKDIIDFFKNKLKEDAPKTPINNNECRVGSGGIFTGSGCDTQTTIPNINDTKDKSPLHGFFTFLLILLPAALSDSINPCAFAVLFLLLSSILSKTQSRKKAIISGCIFSLAIFVSYFLMGVGVYKVLAFSNQIFYVKLGVGILGILVGLANLKDYFWYGKGFIMEVPLAWRPNMKKILKGVTSPLGVFLAGIVVSLFLLPCSSGPYLTILGYLASESNSINLMGYTYMFIYNIIFILPMLVLTFVIGLGVKDVEELTEYKELHKENIHLIVGLMMLALGGYLLFELFFL